MYTRTRRMHSGLSDEMMHMAVEQFLPSVGAGLLITLCWFVCASGPLDASRNLAGDLQPGRIFVMPFSTAADGCGRCVVSAHGTGLYLAGGSRALAAVDHGHCLWAGQLLVAGILLFCHAGDDEAKTRVQRRAICL